MNPSWRRLGDHLCRHLAAFFVALMVLVAGGALFRHFQEANSNFGQDGPDRIRPASRGGASRWLWVGGSSILWALAVTFWECRHRRITQRQIQQNEELERRGRELAAQLEAKKVAGEQAEATLREARLERERCGGELAAERELRAGAERLAQKLKPLGMLASGIAHDFNNILTIVIGNISLSKMTACTLEDRQRWLEQAELAALRAKALTQQLLALSKEGPLLKRPAAVVDLVRDAVRLASPGQNLRIEKQLPAGLWPVEVDEGQVIQALEALVLYADRNMPEGGVMRLAAENRALSGAEVATLKAGDYVHLALSSQGGRFSVTRLARLFAEAGGVLQEDMDYHLVAAQGILQRHEGYLSLEPLGETDARFQVYLPANRAAAMESETVAIPSVGRARRVLVMDDEEGIRQVATVMLRHLGYEPVVTRDGLEALESYRRAQQKEVPYDLVILDLTVPGGMGGKETVQRLRQLDAGAKVVVSSGYFNDPVMARYRHYGFDGVMAKPYKMDELATVVASVLKPALKKP